MKKVRMILSAAVVLTVVGSALAFKPLGAGLVYCFANSDVQNIVTTSLCDASGQPTSTKIDFTVVTSGGSTSNPCPSPSTQTPYFKDIPNTDCVAPVVGTTRYASTAE